MSKVDYFGPLTRSRTSSLTSSDKTDKITPPKRRLSSSNQTFPKTPVKLFGSKESSSDSDLDTSLLNTTIINSSFSENHNTMPTQKEICELIERRVPIFTGTEGPSGVHFLIDKCREFDVLYKDDDVSSKFALDEICNKIRENAYEILRDTSINSFTDLINFLSQNFLVTYSVEELLAQLQSAKQTSTESAIHFSKRVKRLSLDYEGGFKQKYKHDLPNEYVNALTKRSFIYGLRNPNYRSTLITHINSNFEKICELSEMLEQSDCVKTEEIPNQIICQLCSKLGHSAKDCNTSANSPKIICRYCKSVGHSLENCQIRLQNNSQRGQIPQNFNRGQNQNYPQNFNRNQNQYVNQNRNQNFTPIQNQNFTRNQNFNQGFFQRNQNQNFNQNRNFNPNPNYSNPNFSNYRNQNHNFHNNRNQNYSHQAYQNQNNNRNYANQNPPNFNQNFRNINPQQNVEQNRNFNQNLRQQPNQMPVRPNENTNVMQDLSNQFNQMNIRHFSHENIPDQNPIIEPYPENSTGSDE